MRKWLFIFLSIISTNVSFGQHQIADDSLEISSAIPNLHPQFSTFNYSELSQFQNYRNAFAKIPYANTGNIGLPMHSFSAQGPNWNVFQLIGGYQPYLLKANDLNYFRSSQAFTSLKFINGAKEEQFFSAFHTQNIGEGLNISFQFDRINSDGFFVNQFSDHTQFGTNYHLNSRNKRFSSKAAFSYNRLKSLENGGVFVSENDNSNDNTILLDIQLPSAQNRFKSKDFNAENAFDLIVAKSDSALWSGLKITHRFNYQEADKNYKDNVGSSSSFYRNVYLDSLTSADTISLKEIQHSFFIGSASNKIRIGWNNTSYNQFQNYIIDKSFTSDFIEAYVGDSLGKQFVSAELKKGLNGYFQSELLITGNYARMLSARIALTAAIIIENRRARPQMERQRSNHYFYSNNLQNMKSQSILLGLNQLKSKVYFEAKYQRFENYLYYTSQLELLNANAEIHVISFYADKKFTFFKHWNLLNQIHFQQISNKKILPLPNLYSLHSFYYENLFFKNSLLSQIGADLRFVNKYRGYGYNPALSQFHLKENDTVLGPIAQLDVFINLRIQKSAKIFFKMENILLSTYSEKSYRVENYPVPGRVFKFGIEWRMIN